MSLRVENWEAGPYYGAYDTFLDLSSLAEMVELKELKVVFEGHFAVIGVEQLLGMENMKTLSLVSSESGTGALGRKN